MANECQPMPGRMPPWSAAQTLYLGDCRITDGTNCFYIVTLLLLVGQAKQDGFLWNQAMVCSTVNLRFKTSPNSEKRSERLGVGVTSDCRPPCLLARAALSVAVLRSGLVIAGLQWNPFWGKPGNPFRSSRPQYLLLIPDSFYVLAQSNHRRLENEFHLPGS